MMDGQGVVDGGSVRALERLPQQGTMEAQQAMRAPSVEQSMGMARPCRWQQADWQQRLFFLERQHHLIVQVVKARDERAGSDDGGHPAS